MLLQFADRYHLTNAPESEPAFTASARDFYDAFIYPLKISCPASWSSHGVPDSGPLLRMSDQFPGSIDRAKRI